MTEFKIVGVIGKLNDARVAPTLNALCRHLRLRGCEVLVESSTRPMLKGRGARLVSRDELARRSDLVVVIGGDGTLLNAGRTLAPAGVPILGVNQGRLGFMVDVAPADFRQTLDQVLRGKYLREQRLLLDTRIRRGKRVRGPFLAINDVVLRNQAAVRMLEFETWLDDEFISQHRADGIIVSTPTGSTAYALSSGGPVLHPALEAVALVPICPHTFSDRPVVIGSDRVIRIELDGARGVRAMATCDGQRNESVSAGDSIEIRRSPHVLELIHPHGYRYFNLLRSKLHWGRAKAPAPR
ncbi:MAG TPA: NAD(+) kinase [Verrucomicrobiae bacterium]|nr:NAD(+) kinase [Verrucomicrobiae bacterium]